MPAWELKDMRCPAWLGSLCRLEVLQSMQLASKTALVAHHPQPGSQLNFVVIRYNDGNRLLSTFCQALINLNCQYMTGGLPSFGVTGIGKVRAASNGNEMGWGHAGVCGAG